MRLFALMAVAVGLVHAQRMNGTFDRTLNVTGFVDLDLATDAGGIVVVPGPPGVVRIHGVLRAGNNWFSRGDVESRIRQLQEHPPIEQEGNRIRVAVRSPSLLRNIAMRLEVEAPRGSKVRARADSGGVEVRGIQGPVDCQTDSGGIQASEIEGDVRAVADSGGIHLRRVKGAVYARGDSGGVEAMEIAGRVDVGVDSGGVRISQTVPAEIRARTDSGGVDIALARTGGYEIRAHAESGRVTAESVAVNGRLSQHEVNGRLRGGGPLVDVRAGSGNVDIR